MTTERAGSPDRRSVARFPMDREVQYRVLGRKNRRQGREGRGRSIDISSSGVRFTMSHHLFEGEQVELSIDWPAQLDNGVLLKLVISGRVVRSEGSVAAVTITGYEFRTSRRSQWVQAGEADLARASSAAG